MIVLFGLPASGKTTIGKLLASSLEYDFIDLDDEISKISGQNFRTLFLSNESLFREYEKMLFNQIMQNNPKRVVLALGAKTPFFNDLTASNALKIYLKVSKAFAINRIIHSSEVRFPQIEEIKTIDVGVYQQFASYTINAEINKYLVVKNILNVLSQHL